MQKVEARAAGMGTLLSLIALTAACVSLPYEKEKSVNALPEGASHRAYTAHTTIYNLRASPPVTSKTFKSECEIHKRAEIFSYRFSNFLGAGDEPTVVVTLAISGRSAGMGIYDPGGAVRAEYQQGVSQGDYAFFNFKTEQGSTQIKWFLSGRSISSVIESYDVNGALGYSEITVYVPR